MQFATSHTAACKWILRLKSTISYLLVSVCISINFDLTGFPLSLSESIDSRNCSLNSINIQQILSDVFFLFCLFLEFEFKRTQLKILKFIGNNGSVELCNFRTLSVDEMMCSATLTLDRNKRAQSDEDVDKIHARQSEFKSISRHLLRIQRSMIANESALCAV